MNPTCITLLALALGLAACGDSSAPSGAQNPPPPPAQQNDIAIVEGASLLTTTAFSPNPKVVSLGTGGSVMVRWVNGDVTGGDYVSGTATDHTIASDGGEFPQSPVLGGNATYTVTLTATGDYPYHCTLHPNMVGTVTVNP